MPLRPNPLFVGRVDDLLALAAVLKGTARSPRPRTGEGPGVRADERTLDEIAAELGDLPLALTLAGGYLATYRAEAFGVPQVYRTNLRAVLLDHRSLQGAGSAPSLTNHELNVQATFALSYQRLDPADPIDALAIAALARAAQLAPGEPFPRELLLATLASVRSLPHVYAMIVLTSSPRYIVVRRAVWFNSHWLGVIPMVRFNSALWLSNTIRKP